MEKQTKSVTLDQLKKDRDQLINQGNLLSGAISYVQQKIKELESLEEGEQDAA